MEVNAAKMKTSQLHASLTRAIDMLMLDPSFLLLARRIAMFNHGSRHLRLAFSIVTATIVFLCSGYSVASADSKHHFRFVGISAASATDEIVFTGDGEFGPFTAVHGSGSYVEFMPCTSTPCPLISTGTWDAIKFISFTSPGSSGHILAGHLKIQVALLQTSPSFAVISATLDQFCNVPFAGLMTGAPEGIVLTELTAPSKTFTQATTSTGAPAGGHTNFSTTRE
jgi:hypothetical protein